MKTLFVSKKSELTEAAKAYKFEQSYRTRLYCNCKTIPGLNRRNGILIIDKDRVVARIIKCKSCAKEVYYESR